MPAISSSYKPRTARHRPTTIPIRCTSSWPVRGVQQTGASRSERDMPSTVRARRSVLFMSGSNARAIERARTLPADALIFDLEDAVAPDAKEKARQMVCDAVRAGGYGKRELIVRVNAPATLWGDADLAAVAPCGVDAVRLPQVLIGDTVRQVSSILTAH